MLEWILLHARRNNFDGIIFNCNDGALYMKILILGDWHLGVKADDEWTQNIQRDGIKQAIELSKKKISKRGFNTVISLTCVKQ